MRWKAAHLHAPSTGDIAGSEVHIQKRCRLFCIFAVHFKEVADLIQHQIVRMRFLDGMIAVVGGVSRRILCPCLIIIKRLFVWRKIAVQPDQLRDTRSSFVPVHLNIRTAALFQHDALAVVLFITAAFSGHSMGMSADAVLFFQKISALPGRVRGLEKRIDAVLSALKAAPMRKRSRNFIFGDKPAGCWNSRHIRVILPARQGQFFQPGKKRLRTVKMKPHQLSILPVGVKEYFVFRQKSFPELRI